MFGRSGAMPNATTTNPCATGYPSVLRVESIGGGQGLSDRLLRIAQLGNLAASLCARLALPPPCEVLGAKERARGRAAVLMWPADVSTEPRLEMGGC